MCVNGLLSLNHEITTGHIYLNLCTNLADDIGLHETNIQAHRRSKFSPFKDGGCLYDVINAVVGVLVFKNYIFVTIFKT